MTYDLLPKHMRKSARAYVEDGHEPGEFLVAVLSNDFIKAHRCADDINREAMFAWAEWIWWECPANAWGSKEAVKNWVART